MSKRSDATERREQARKVLSDLLNPGDVVHIAYAGQRSQSNQRYIVLLPWMNGSEPGIRNITHLVAEVIGAKLTDEGSIMMGGWGYSKPFHIVYSIGRALYPDGVACAGRGRCHSNDHANGSDDYGRDVVHHDAGYAFTVREV